MSVHETSQLANWHKENRQPSRGCPLGRHIFNKGKCACGHEKPATKLNRRKWQGVSTAPRDATWVQVKMANGKILKAHWAEGGGEEQPLFRGWFVDAGSYMRGIADPVAWRPLK